MIFLLFNTHRTFSLLITSTSPMTDPYTLMQRRHEKEVLQSRIRDAHTNPETAEGLRKSLQTRSRWKTGQAKRLKTAIKNASRPMVVKRMLASAKARARKLGLPFNLTSGDIQFPEVCPALGLTLISGAYVGTGKAADESPSLDKIIPSKGYVRGNVRVVSQLANRMKSNATPQQLRAFCRWGLAQTDYLERDRYSEFEPVKTSS
jgi:hypothetical protein